MKVRIVEYLFNIFVIPFNHAGTRGGHRIASHE
jgi:hypothetical protein